MWWAGREFPKTQMNSSMYRTHLGRLLCPKPLFFSCFQGISRFSRKLVGPWDQSCGVGTLWPIYPVWGLRWGHELYGSWDSFGCATLPKTCVFCRMLCIFSFFNKKNGKNAAPASVKIRHLHSDFQAFRTRLSLLRQLRLGVLCDQVADDTKEP